jgi:hypothetical protein
MELRRVLLRILLVALALAALAGVVGVLTAAGDTIWRIVGTAIATAVAVGIMLPFSWMIDKQKWRACGLGGMIWAVVAYLLAIALIWEFGTFGSWRAQESVGLTLVSWILCGLPAVILLAFAGIPQGRIAAWTGVYLAAGVFCLFMVGVWKGVFSTWSGSDVWWESAMALAGVGVLVVANLAHAGTSDRRWGRWVGILAAAGAWLLAEAGILQQTSSPLGRQMLTGLASLAGVLGLANLAVLVPLEGMQRLVRSVTIAAAAVCAAAINLLVYFDTRWDEEIWGRAAAGSGIVAGCGSLALLVLARINRRVEYRPDEGAVLATVVALVCPRCSKSQKIALGGAACKACGLRIEITIEEPRCPKCGYLLYMLQSPVCPECGAAIGGKTQVAGGEAAATIG